MVIMNKHTVRYFFIAMTMCCIHIKAMDKASTEPESEETAELLVNIDHEKTNIKIDREKYYIIHHVQLEELLLRNGLNLSEQFQALSKLREEDNKNDAFATLRKIIHKAFKSAKKNLDDDMIDTNDDFDAITNKLRLMSLKRSAYKNYHDEIRQNEEAFYSNILEALLNQKKTTSSSYETDWYSSLLNQMDSLTQNFFIHDSISILPTINMLFERSRDRSNITIHVLKDDQSEYNLVPVYPDRYLTIYDCTRRHGIKVIMAFLLVILVVEGYLIIKEFA